MAASIGKVAAAQNIAQYFVLLASMGIPTYGVKLIAQYQLGSKESSKAFSELFIINFVLSTVCTLCYYTLIFKCNYFEGKHVLYSVTGLVILFNIINVDWFYQGIQEYGYIAARSLIIKCLSLVALLMFVKDANDYILYALISSMALVCNYLFNIFRLKKYIHFSIRNIAPQKHIKPILTLFVATIAAEVYVLADTTMLNYMCSNTIVGYYSMSMNIIRIIRTLVIAVSAVFLPQLSYLYFSGEIYKFDQLMNKGLHVIAMISLPVAAGLSLVADEAIIVLFGEGFRGAILTTRILALSIITVAFSNFIGMQVLVTIGKEKITTISTICGAIINISLNLLLIHYYAHVGAAIASVITEASVTMIQIMLAKRYVSFNFGLKNAVIPTVTMTLVVLIIKSLDINLSIRLVLEIISGAAVYISIAYYLKDDFIYSVLNAGKSFVKGRR